jgi:serine/threonine protein kinase
VNDELLGKQLGSYQLIEQLGRGAFGSVYLGKHFLLEHKPLVAIKVLNNTLTSQEEINRFFQEAVLLDQLTHPNILPILDANIYEGYPFFVAEYAPGGSLRDRIDQLNGTPMPLDEAIHVISQIGQGLQHAHDLDIVHRDLKPANILFNIHGDAVLADFGISIHVHKTSRADEIGTPTYMSPEQFKGKVSKRSDQYALGCIVYELFTGQTIFSADDPYTIGYKHIYEQPIEPRDLNPDIAPEIEEVILKAIAKNRDDRYATVTDFVQAIQQASGRGPESGKNHHVYVYNPPLEPQKHPPKDSPSMEVHQSPHAKKAPLRQKTNETQPENQLQSIQSRPITRPNRSTPTSTTGTISQLQPAWHVMTGLDHTYYSEPTISNGIVYAGTYATAQQNRSNPNQLHALDAATGRLLWAAQAEHSIYDAPAVANGVVYTSSGDINKAGKIYAINAESGHTLWTYDTEIFIKAMPSIVNDIVYAHSQHAVFAIDAANGQELWSVTLKSEISNRPIIINNVVYIGTEFGHCYAVDARNGTKLAKYTDTGEVHAAVIIGSSVWCLCSHEDELYALDVKTSEKHWSTQIEKHISGGMAIANGIAYLGSNSGFVGDSSNTKLLAVDVATGKPRWSAQVTHEIESTPVISGNHIFVSTFGRELHIIEAQHGKVQLTTKVGRGRINRPSVGEGMLFVSTGEMYAFHLR